MGNKKYESKKSPVYVNYGGSWIPERQNNNKLNRWQKADSKWESRVIEFEKEDRRFKVDRQTNQAF